MTRPSATGVLALRAVGAGLPKRWPSASAVRLHGWCRLARSVACAFELDPARVFEHQLGFAAPGCGPHA
ncbi:MAG TPA: hypothetical protein VFK05_03790 [Polyangiaceae bacterium]|nr:hypothetical protein [Polyangiaceae bacterium]